MIKCKLTDEEIKNEDKSGISENIANNLGKKVIERHNYNPIGLSKSEIIAKDIFNRGTDYGKDDVIFVDEIPINDPLKLKEIEPFDKDKEYYSINYKAHQFADDEINVMLMKIRQAKSFYTSEKFLEYCIRGNAEAYKLQGVLSKEKKTDLCFFIKWATEEYYPDIAPKSLINGYIIPFIPLRDLILSNLNFIRENNGLKPLKHRQKNLKKLFNIYETWELYNEIDFKIKRSYPFRLFVKKDKRIDQIPSLMMKIPKEHLTNYILVNENGDIIEKKP